LQVLLIDNYDSFTYNIVEQLRRCGVTDVMVYKNDEISVQDALQYQHIIISPGPKVPAQSGIIVDLAKAITQQKLLGICLGHQAIAEAYGASLYNLPTPYHGYKAKLLLQKPDLIFENVQQHAQAGLYHSWAVQGWSPKVPLTCIATSTDNVIMACKHSTKHIYGVQFHTESYITSCGDTIISNWLSL
jgi:anthranilate synthase component II